MKPFRLKKFKVTSLESWTRARTDLGPHSSIAILAEGNQVTLMMVWFGLVWWTPSIGRKVGIPRGILPHVQTGYWESRLACLIQTIGNPDWSG